MWENVSTEVFTGGCVFRGLHLGFQSPSSSWSNSIRKVVLRSSRIAVAKGYVVATCRTIGNQPSGFGMDVHAKVRVSPLMPWNGTSGTMVAGSGCHMCTIGATIPSLLALQVQLPQNMVTRNVMQVVYLVLASDCLLVLFVT